MNFNLNINGKAYKVEASNRGFAFEKMILIIKGINEKFLNSTLAWNQGGDINLPDGTKIQCKYEGATIGCKFETGDTEKTFIEKWENGEGANVIIVKINKNGKLPNHAIEITTEEFFQRIHENEIYKKIIKIDRQSSKKGGKQVAKIKMGLDTATKFFSDKIVEIGTMEIA